MQKKYVYFISEPAGKNFHQDFAPELEPKIMLELGVFGGKYMTDCTAEFPQSWFKKARLCSERHDPKLNFFGVNASQSLREWHRKGGFTKKTRAAGFNGTADITSAAGAQMTSARSSAGELWADTLGRSRKTAIPETLLVALSSDKSSCSGHTIHANYESACEWDAASNPGR